MSLWTRSLKRFRYGSLEIIDACTLPLAVFRAVGNDEVHDLLLAQPRPGAEVCECHIISTIAVVFQILSLPQPGIFESHILRHPAFDSLVGNAGVEIDDKREEVETLLQVCQTSNATFIVVSNEVGLGLVPNTSLGRLYRDLLGQANQTLAARADAVYFMVAGLAMEIKLLASQQTQ